MGKKEVWIGNNQVVDKQPEPKGEFVEIDRELYYRISDFNYMPDFFISIVSDSDHWMFLSSNGSLSCGRKNRNNSLFPYYTDDKIHDYRGQTGSRTIIRAKQENKTFLWEPFTDESAKAYQITRNIYKSVFGNKILFEEFNYDLGLRFRYGWANSEKFGFIKRSAILNLSDKSVSLEILDGIQNILPSGIDYGFQNEFSNLLDAYKKNELVPNTSLAVYSLSSIPVDRAEPSESLRATTVWSTGTAKNTQFLLSEKQISNFRCGGKISQEDDVRAARGAYFIYSNTALKSARENKWTLVAEINQDSTQVNNLVHFLKNTDNAELLISEDILKGTENLKRLVATADGLQLSNTGICSARHYTNTLFNIMRGGVFAQNYMIPGSDFKSYLFSINKPLAENFKSWMDQLPTEFSHNDLISRAESTENKDLIRIAYEYLPLIFSRRHGDPSRPWNIFSIETKNEDGSLKYNYQGNWRDIFQNWEALLLSYPEFTEGVISKFLNASTPDGYNPYRIMRNGIDWERPDPEDPWAYIGYWGDHQIIYLQKLLELSRDFHPGKLEKLLTSDLFVYANVPYRIKKYDDILANPKDTVVFDFELDKSISAQLDFLGADAKLLKDQSGKNIYKVNLTEKILATLLSKLSNFIPEAGIWLNTQRPEWNDANNALVGNGTSMVTLYYMRRFLSFWKKEFDHFSEDMIWISEELVNVFNEFHAFLKGNMHLTETGFDDRQRKKFADFLGSVHAEFRSTIYNDSFSGSRIPVKVTDLESFINVCLLYMDQSIAVNKRTDGLYHAYNLISIADDKIAIRHLYEMLEGQVAVLSSGVLTPEESLAVLDALKKSKMFREDQFSYMLYPNRQLPLFIEKNNISADQVEKSALLGKLANQGEDKIIKKDESGNFHFNSAFRNADMLKAALQKLALKNNEYAELLKKEERKILDIYEQVFDHQSFTGRSGTFYGYEGLGSIYWHMVSKLQLATQENFFNAVKTGSKPEVIARLKQHYYEIKAGIGLYKKPGFYGAFPTDAYSHTPGNAGVKQPGLTGQVKEDFISRQLELGVVVLDGKIQFRPELINDEEFLQQETIFQYIDLKGNEKAITVEQHQLAFTFCQVPVLISNSGKSNIEIIFSDGKSHLTEGLVLDKKTSAQVFGRSGSVEQIKVNIEIKSVK